MAILDSLMIRPLTTNDFDISIEALAMLNRTQGVGLFKDDYLTNHLQSANSLVLGAFINKDLVGIAVVEAIDDFTYYLPFDPKLSKELANRRVASFATLAVVEHHQGQGIGTALSRRRLEWAKAKQCDVVIGVSWVSGLAHTSNRTFARMGFSPIALVDDFYVESSMKDPFDCPGCKVSPCRCSAILYRLNF